MKSKILDAEVLRMLIEKEKIEINDKLYHDCLTNFRTQAEKGVLNEKSLKNLDVI